jgi:hypothetical protein
MSRIKVCPANRALSKGKGEWSYILIFLLLNFACSVLFYPMKSDVPTAEVATEVFAAILIAIGSPIYLRARVLA